jgi:hypothetical protein
VKIRSLATWTVSISAILVLSACSGGSHAAVAPAANAPAQTGAAARNANFALTLRIAAPAGALAVQSSTRTPQYISGRTAGMYVSYACTGTCTGNPAPTGTSAVYADLSPTSPLCGGSAGAPVTAPYTCAIGLTLQGGYTYALTGVAVNQAPLGSVNGYGTGFCTGGGTVFGSGTCSGSGVIELSIVTGNVPIQTGTVNSLSGTLNPIVTQFAATGTTSSNGALTSGDGVRARPAYGEVSVDIGFETGDGAGNLVTATSGCGSPAAPPCEQFADPFGGTSTAPVLNNGTGPSLTSGSLYRSPNEDKLNVTTDTVTGLGTFNYAANLWPASCSSCFSGNAGNQNDFTIANAIPAPGGYDVDFIWDGTPSADNPPGCSGQSCYGVPILIDIYNDVPCTSGYNGCSWGASKFNPLIYTTGQPCAQYSCNYSAGLAYYIAPFEVILSCGSNPTCGTSFSQGTNVANAANGGTIQLDAYLYHAGNAPFGQGCYGSSILSTSPSHNCLTIATNGQNAPGGTPPSACYSSGTCDAVQSATPGLWYCYPPNYPATGTAAGAVASIQFNTFTSGSQANQFVAGGSLGVADWTDFTIALLSSSGTCSFQVQDWRNNQVDPNSAIITISPSGSGSTPINVTIPTPSPIL